jgi:hypothetical protein
MAAVPLLECSFLIPIRRDAEISEGNTHANAEWIWLKDALVNQFGGGRAHQERMKACGRVQRQDGQ